MSKVQRGPKRILDRRALNPRIKELSVISPYRGLVAVFRQWVIIGLAAGAAAATGHWAVYICAMVVIATRQNALMVAMHEASHYALIPHRKWNDWAGEFLCGLPLGFSLKTFRPEHNAHHLYLGSARDPDSAASSNVAGSATPRRDGFAPLRGMREFLGRFETHYHKTPWPFVLGLASQPRIRYSPAERFSILALLLTAGALVAWFNLWLQVLLLWVLPVLLILSVLLRIRGLAEHGRLAQEHECNATRFVRANWLERLTVAPMNANYHLQHHLFPSVPFYNMPRLEALLREQPEYCRLAHKTEGYWRACLEKQAPARLELEA